MTAAARIVRTIKRIRSWVTGETAQAYADDWYPLTDNGHDEGTDQ